MVSIDNKSTVQIGLLGSLLVVAVVGTANIVTWKGRMEADNNSVAAIVEQLNQSARKTADAVSDVRAQLVELRYQLAQINVSLSTDNLKWFAEQLKLLNPDLRMPTIPYR
jgi:hypothetical protein